MTKASDILVHCSHSELADVVSLIPNPRNPNKHPDRQIAMLAKIIRHQGWRSPIVVSNRSGFVVKGHGRLEAAKLLQVEKVPVDRQNYSTEADEWADLIADNRIAELAETDDQEIATMLKELDGKIDLAIAGFDQEAEKELREQLGSESLSDKYTHKIDAPVYEPKGEKPPLAELANEERANELLAEIKSSQLPKDICRFLELAATRHIVFDYGKIAEFYCHADKKTQELMENSALVIIDFNKAMQLGYVKMKEEISELIEQEQGQEHE